MSNCAICGKPVKQSEASIDHLRPAGGIPTQINVQTVHTTCNRRKRNLFWRMYYRVVRWLAGKKPCHKTELGYNCKHHVYADGTRECD